MSKEKLYLLNLINITSHMIPKFCPRDRCNGEVPYGDVLYRNIYSATQGAVKPGRHSH